MYKFIVILLILFASGVAFGQDQSLAVAKDPIINHSKAFKGSVKWESAKTFIDILYNVSHTNAHQSLEKIGRLSIYFDEKINKTVFQFDVIKILEENSSSLIEPRQTQTVRKIKVALSLEQLKDFFLSIGGEVIEEMEISKKSGISGIITSDKLYINKSTTWDNGSAGWNK